MKMDKQKITILALSAVLFLTFQYIILEKFEEEKQQEMINKLQDAYDQGMVDAVTVIYKETEDCRGMSINVENMTKIVVDYSCIESNTP